MVNLLKSAAGALGRAYDYITPGAGSSRLTDYGGWGDQPTSAPTPRAVTPPPMPQAPGVAAGADALASARNLLASLGTYTTPTPRLAKFDFMANYEKSKQQAEAQVNPLYEKKLNDFLAKNQAQKAQTQQQTALTKENIGTERQQTLEDNAINRQRTGEDATRAIENINQQEGQFQGDEGDSFDADYRKTAEELSANGADNTGLGGQVTSDQVRLRNVTSQRQLDEFKGQREAKQIMKDRTFADLAKGDDRAAKLADSKTKQADFDLDKALEDLAFDESDFRLGNEIERLGAVSDATERNRQSNVDQFLAGLPGQGYGAADIAATRQVYG